MTNRNYVRGRNYEYRVKKRLEKEGWMVLRTAGSHGFADLVAIKIASGILVGSGTHSPNGTYLPQLVAGFIKLIQCKVGTSKERAIHTVEKTGLKEKYSGLYQVTVEIL